MHSDLITHSVRWSHISCIPWSDIYKNVFASVTTITDDITYPWTYVR